MSDFVQPVLLGMTISVYTRIVRLALKEKGVEYQFREIDIFSDQGVPASYLEHHPFGRIPAFQHGELSIYETSAIARYIDEAFAVGPPLQPELPVLRARMNQIIGLMDSYAYRAMVWDVFVERIAKPEEGETPDEETISSALPVIETCLAELDSWLGNQVFLAGAELTLSDLHVFPMLLYFAQTPEGISLLNTKPGLQEWLLRMQERESVQSTRSAYG